MFSTPPQVPYLASLPGSNEQKCEEKPLIVKSGFFQFSPNLLDVTLTQEELDICGNNTKKQKELIEKKLREATLQNSKLENVLICVSLFKETYAKEYLDSLIATLRNFYENPNNGFKKINFYVAGLLQRHNFWNFTQNMTDIALQDLLKDFSSDAIENETQLAQKLAERFWQCAIDAENKFIDDCKRLVEEHIADCNLVFYRWDDLTPISVEAKKDEAKYAAYSTYHKIVDTEFAKEEKESNGSSEAKKGDEQSSLRKTINKAIGRVIGPDPNLPVEEEKHDNTKKKIREKIDRAQKEKQRKRQSAILDQAKRILTLLNLPLYLPYQLAYACCKHYILEECAGFPILNKGGWTALAYPATKNDLDFFAQTEELMKKLKYINNPVNWINIYYAILDISDDYSINLYLEYPHAPSSRRKPAVFTSEPPVAPSPLVKIVPKITRSKSEVELARQRIKVPVVETYSWLKDPALLHLQYSEDDGYWDLSLQPAKDKLDENLDREYTERFIQIIRSLSGEIQGIKLNYICSHFSPASALKIFSARPQSGYIHNFDLSNNNLNEFMVSELAKICKTFTQNVTFNNNQLYKFRQESLLYLIQSFSNAKTLDLRNNGFYNLTYDNLLEVFVKIPASVIKLKIDAQTFVRTRSKADLLKLISHLSKKVVLEIEGLQKGDKIQVAAEVRDVEISTIAGLAGRMKDAAILAYALQKKSPITSFFRHTNEDERKVKATIEKLYTATSVAEAASIINELLSRKGATLYDNSFDTIYIRRIYASGTPLNDFDKYVSDAYDNGKPHFKIEFSEGPKDSKEELTNADRTRIKKAVDNMLSRFTSYKEEALDIHGQKYQMYHRDAHQPNDDWVPHRRYSNEW